MPFYRLNEVFFNTFSHLSLILLEDVSINVRSYSRITMSKVLGNSLDVKSVVNHETGVAVTKCMNAECWQVVIDKDFLQLLVGETPTVVVTNGRSEYDVGMYPRITNGLLELVLLTLVP